MTDTTFDQYETLELKDGRFSDYVFGEGEAGKCIKGLRRINIFVGPTSSGKSRLLRSIYSGPKYRFGSRRLSSKQFSELVAAYSAETNSISESVAVWGGVQRDSLKQIALGGAHVYDSEGGKSPAKLLEEVERVMNHTGELGYTVKGGYYREHWWQSQIVRASQRFAAALGPMLPGVGGEERVYVPILRGLRPPFEEGDHSSVVSDIYEKRTKKDYFSDKKDEGGVARTIFSGLGLYSDLKRRLLESSKSRAEVAEYERFLSAHLFDGKQIEVIPRIGDDVVHIKIGEQEDRPIHHVGDGVQSIILLTYLPFFSQKRTLFFLEEPDIFLHPGLQRKLMDLFAYHERFRMHQFFLTTHSNHLLDLTLDYSEMAVFLFRRKEAKFVVQNTSTTDRAVLTEIGARASGLFLTNASVWVEGITDRLYLRAFLKAFLDARPKLRKLSEDTHYTILELGGSNLVHWRFSGLDEGLKSRIDASKVCSSSFVILDGDNTGKGSREELLRSELEDDFHIWSLKEIENYIPEELLRTAVTELIGRSKLTDIERQSALEKVGLISSGKYRKSPLGKYLDTTLGLSGYFAAVSGTLKSDMKNKICAIVTNRILDMDAQVVLDDEVIGVCNRVFDFICKSNGIDDSESLR